MAEHFDSVKGALPQSNGLDQNHTATRQQHATSGTFALRRTLYFQRNNTGGMRPENGDINVVLHAM